MMEEKWLPCVVDSHFDFENLVRKRIGFISDKARRPIPAIHCYTIPVPECGVRKKIMHGCCCPGTRHLEYSFEEIWNYGTTGDH